MGQNTENSFFFSKKCELTPYELKNFLGTIKTRTKDSSSRQSESELKNKSVKYEKKVEDTEIF